MIDLMRLVGYLAIALLLVVQPTAGSAWVTRSVSVLAANAHPAQAAPVGVERDFGQLPLYFVQNRGQLDPQVAYYIQGSDKTIYFTPQGLTLALAGEALTPGPSPIDSMGEGGGEAAYTGPRDETRCTEEASRRLAVHVRRRLA